MEGYTPSGSQICSSGVVTTLFTENKFTYHDCWVEIYQNSDDAESKEMIVTYIKLNNYEFLKISDDGCGMTMEQIDNSLNLLKRGSKGSGKHGKFNFGGKAAILQFSGIADYIHSGDKNYNGICIVQSKSEDSEPVCYEMVGKELIEKGWAGTVQPAYLDSGRESVMCSKLWEKFPIKKSGTNIFIQLTQSMKEELAQCHEDKWKDLQLACNTRLNHCKLTMYTHDNLKCDILYQPIIDNRNIIRQKFLSIPIAVFEKDGKYLFLVSFKELIKDTTNNLKYEDVLKIIKPHGKRWSKNLETIGVNIFGNCFHDYQFIGSFQMDLICNFTYNKDEKLDDNNDIHIIRNGFCLNKFPNPYCDRKSRGGDYYIRNIWKNIKSTISYDTKTNGDKLDKIIGVNMHKADIKWDKLPTNLQRTIEGILEISGNKMVKYIQKVEYNPVNSKKNVTDFKGGDYNEKYEKWLGHLPKYKVQFHKKNVCDQWKLYMTLKKLEAESDSDSDPDPPPPPTPPSPRLVLKRILDECFNKYQTDEEKQKELITILENYMNKS